MSDYLEAYDRSEQRVRSLTRDQANRALCAALEEDSYPGTVLGAVQDGGAVPQPRSSGCVDREKSSLNIGRFSWEFSRLSTGEVLATRTARIGWPYGALSRGLDVETEERDGLVLTFVTARAWRCPIAPDDPCDTVGAQEPGAGEVRCTSDGLTACRDDGFDGAVHVVDIATHRSLMFGTFEHRPAPRVSVTPSVVTVTAGDCQQSMPRPW